MSRESFILSTPPQDGGFIGDANLGMKGEKLWTIESLYKHISKLIFGINVQNMKRTSSNPLMDKVIVKCQMFHTRMIHWIATKIYSAGIITK